MSAKSQSIETAEAAFRGEHPYYANTTVLDELRRSDFARLDRGGHVYLDYTGGGLFASSQLRQHHAAARERRVRQSAFASIPHRPRARELVEARRAITCCEFFGAAPEEYVAIFTPNATGALRLVGEAYPFRVRTTASS